MDWMKLTAERLLLLEPDQYSADSLPASWYLSWPFSKQGVFPSVHFVFPGAGYCLCNSTYAEWTKKI